MLEMKPKVVSQLSLAIKTMRDACDRAERTIRDGDGNACIRVMHDLTWGLANASSHIETALSHNEEAHKIQLFELKAGNEPE